MACGGGGGLRFTMFQFKILKLTKRFRSINHYLDDMCVCVCGRFSCLFSLHFSSFSLYLECKLSL